MTEAHKCLQKTRADDAGHRLRSPWLPGHPLPRGPALGTDLVVAVHQLQSSAGLLLLHVAQSTLQAEHNIFILLHDLRGRSTPEL